MKSTRPLWTLLCVAACTAPQGEAPPVAAADPFAPSEEERAEILAAVQDVFDAIATGDTALLNRSLMPDAYVASARAGSDGGGQIARSSADQLATTVTRAPGTMVERMWQPEVRVSGGIATVWTPYDFYRDGEFSHCGVDAAHLMRTEGRWQIVALVWSALQPPTCAAHPEGPPARDNSR